MSRTSTGLGVSRCSLWSPARQSCARCAASWVKLVAMVSGVEWLRQMMMKFPEMEHDGPNSRRLDAEHHGEMLWQFTEVGEFEFACLIPGHLEAGMRGTIVVRDAANTGDHS